MNRLKADPGSKSLIPMGQLYPKRRASRACLSLRSASNGNVYTAGGRDWKQYYLLIVCIDLFALLGVLYMDLHLERFYGLGSLHFALFFFFTSNWSRHWSHPL